MVKVINKKAVIINNERVYIDWYKTAFLERHLENNQSKILDYKKIIEIGAYDCEESLKFTSIFPNASITAFECSPKLIDKCRYNSNKSDRITLVEKMVTDTPDNTIFYNCKGGESSMCYPKYDKHYLINVSTIRMDEYLDNSEVDFLWIDVQGAELNVLHSFGNKLKNVNTIYCEVDICKYRYDSDSTLDTVSEFLFNNGYQIKDIMILNPNEVHVIFE